MSYLLCLSDILETNSVYMLTEYIYEPTTPYLKPVESDEFLNLEVFIYWDNNMTHKLYIINHLLS